MRSFSLSFSVLAALCFAQTAFAQGREIQLEKQPDRKETLKIRISGGLDADAIFRSGEIIDHRGGVNNPAADDDEFTVEAQARLRFDVDMEKKVTLTIAMANQRLNNGTTFALGENPEDTGIIFDDLSVKIEEFLDPNLTLKAGIVPVVFDLTGRGAFFLDPRYSNRFDKNVGGLVLGFEDELQPVGAWGTYVKEALTVSVYLLPAIVEGGRSKDDEAAYGVWFTHAMDSPGKGSKFGGIFSINSFAGGDTSVFTLGGGAVLKNISPNLDAYAEAYFQFGDAGKTAAGRSRDAGGTAFQAGVDYSFPDSHGLPWVGFNITWISGDDDPIDGDVDDFLSYENVNDLKILEDQWFGVDVDSNYLSFKFSAGMTMLMGEAKRQLNLRAILGINRLDEEIVNEDRIGHELDVSAKLLWSKQVSFNGGIGWLFSSDVFDDLGTRHESNAYLLWIGTDVIF